MKTLNDLKHDVIDQIGNESITYTKLVDIDDIHKAAIEWIKLLREEGDKINKSPELFHEWYSKRGSVLYPNTDIVNWIKHFFNITEEDLK